MQPLSNSSDVVSPALAVEEEKLAYSMFKEFIQKINSLCEATGKNTILLEDKKINLCRDSIAYFVEANRQQEPLWKEQLPAFINEIDRISREHPPEKALSEVFWRLHQGIDALYGSSLFERINECVRTKNDDQHEKLQVRFGNYNNLKKLNELLRGQGKCAVISGIPRDELPQWYLKQYAVSVKKGS